MEIQYDINLIKKVLPHRFPFLLIDRVLEIREGYSKALKNVTFNEDFFNGHFPNDPVMPGVLQIEALAQTSCFLAYYAHKDNWNDNAQVFFASIESVRFRKKVVPGDQLILEAHIERQRGRFWWTRGTASVDDEVVCEASFSAVISI
ncbi:3-hydroxyacyl-ACP dehydratase FabZ [Deferribacterales bacterium RsTz2092]|nr:3-hydroxyacyl-[acyl-carrier-protein] dehydratase FabZ [Deferribacterales bacterium]